MRAASKFMKKEVLKTRRQHLEELNGLGMAELFLSIRYWIFLMSLSHDL